LPLMRLTKDAPLKLIDPNSTRNLKNIYESYK